MKSIFSLVFTLITLLTSAQNAIEKRYSNNVNCSGIDVVQTFDGGFLISASKNPISQYEGDLFIIRTDSYGDTLWTKTYPIDSGIVTKGIQTYDSGYVFTGKKGKYMFLLKLNELGDFLWEQTYYFGTTYSKGNSVYEASDHTLFVLGENFIGVGSCCLTLVIRTDVNGNILKNINLPIPDGRAYDIVETPDSGFIISSSQIYGPPYPVLTKINKNGEAIWRKSYGEHCECNVNLTNDLGFLISGSQINNDRPYLLKTDSLGNVIWDKRSTNYSVYNRRLKVVQLNDGGFIMVGGDYNEMFGNPNNIVSDLILLKTNSQGDSIWGNRYGGAGNDFGYAVINTDDNGVAMVGYSINLESGLKEVFFIKANYLGQDTSVAPPPIIQKQIRISPNPFTLSTIIDPVDDFDNSELILYNAFGKQVKHIKNISGDSYILHRGELSSGIYFMQLIEKNRVIQLGKIVISNWNL